MTKNPQSDRSWFARLPDSIWAPLSASCLILVVGLMGVAAHQVWLFPSLGPSIFIFVETPNSPSARFYNTIVGHLLGLGAGCLAVVLLGADRAPAVLADRELTPVRVGAAVVAIGLNMLGGVLLKATHPPSAATTLLFALGSLKPNWHDVITVMLGVTIVATLGQGVRSLRVSSST